MQRNNNIGAFMKLKIIIWIAAFISVLKIINFAKVSFSFFFDFNKQNF